MSRRCRGCGRPLRRPSLGGYGPVCRARIVPAAPSPARATTARHAGVHTPAQLDLEEDMTDQTDELERIGHELLLRRVRAAEGVAFQALNLPPQKDETAHQFAARIRDYTERHHPELIVRFEHSRQEVLPLAETCGCDPDSDGYDDDHIESDEPGEYLCARQHLGFVCGTCVQPDGEEDGPEWAPTRFEWPCPPVAALDLP